MGEYATYNGQHIKIGTCESMYYLRADQAQKVTPEAGSVDPVRDAEHIRFRFPFPDEDTIRPGGFEEYGRTVHVPGLTAPAGADHYTVQFRADNGYLASLPCPESDTETSYTVHRNGYGGAVGIAQQRVWEGRLVLVAQCRGCGAAWRYPDAADVLPVLESLADLASEERREGNRYGSETRAQWWDTIASRISEGYTSPPAWVDAMSPAVSS